MSSQWLDNYASDILNGVISLGLNGISDDAELRRYISRGQIELYLLGGLREWTNWRIRGFRLLHLGANDVMQDEGGFPEITNEHIVHRM